MNATWFSVLMGDDNRVSRPLIASDDELFGIEAYDLKTGRLCATWSLKSVLYSDDPRYDGVPDDMLANSLGLPVFSLRLREALAEKAIGVQDIQYLPVRVACSNGEESSGFAIANILFRIAALDAEHSTLLHVDDDEIDPLTGRGKVTGIGKEALRADALVGHDVIRLLEFFPSVLVSKRFVDTFTGHGFTGATFTPLAVY